MGIIVAASVLMTEISFSHDKTQLIPIALLIANPQNYADQTVSVHGVTDKNEIRRLIRSSERSPRPGDNLGHDAQPSNSISE